MESAHTGLSRPNHLAAPGGRAPCATHGRTTRSRTRIRPPALRHLRPITCRWARPASGQPRWQLEQIARENQPQAAFPLPMHLRDVHLVAQPARERREVVEATSAARHANDRVSTPPKASERSCRSSQSGGPQPVDSAARHWARNGRPCRQGMSSSIKSGMRACGRTLYRLPTSKEMP